MYFNELCLNTDKFTYFLNNVRRKGHGKKSIMNKEKPLFPTNIVATCDLRSKYVFRADVALAKDIKDGFINYKEYKLHSYPQKTDKYKLVNPNTDISLDNLDQFSLGLKTKKSNTDVFNINSSYTNITQLWLINTFLIK